MKIAIIGAGAMGSIYASFLAQNNNDVLAIDLWEDHIKAINTNNIVPTFTANLNPSVVP